MTTIQSNQYAKFHSNIRNYVNSNFSQNNSEFSCKDKSRIKWKSLVTSFQCQFRCPSLILYVFFTSTGVHLCNVINTSSFSMHIHPMTTYIMSANTICQCIKFNLRILFIFVKFVSLFDSFLSYELLLERIEVLVNDSTSTISVYLFELKLSSNFYAYLNKLGINYDRIIFLGSYA